ASHTEVFGFSPRFVLGRRTGGTVECWRQPGVTSLLSGYRLLKGVGRATVARAAVRTKSRDRFLRPDRPVCEAQAKPSTSWGGSDGHCGGGYEPPRRGSIRNFRKKRPHEAQSVLGRIVKVERRAVVGTESRFEERLQRSEDSSTLNTSFIERLNLTIRHGSAYLCRRTICHARWKERLEGHLELLRCHYNFVRPHRALKFGKDMRTPAMQAGITRKPLTLRQIFCSGIVLLVLCEIVLRVRLCCIPSFSGENAVLQAA